MEFVVVTLVIVCLSVFLYYKHAFNYWKRKQLPYIEPKFPFGNLGNPIIRKQGLYRDLADAYYELKSKGYKHGGFYSIIFPVYMPIHSDYLKNVLVKDFNHFVNHGISCNEKEDPLSVHLVTIEDDKWRNLRAKLTPTFTSGKMKMMFNTVKKCADPLIQEIDIISSRHQPFDIKEFVARFSTDVIGSCAFGIDCNSFKDPNAEFRKYGKLSFEVDFFGKFRLLFMFILPKIAKAIKMRHTNKEVSDFFMRMVKNTVRYREEHNVNRPDFMQLLINLKNSPGGLTLNEVSAQAFIFFLAGFETSSTTMTFCLYELAKNQKIQDEVRKEINSILLKYNDEITYDAMQEMVYLGQVINETLRKYPPVPTISRVCNKRYQVPETDVVIEKGTFVSIPIYAIHHDPEYYPDPEKFDPDRFSDENKHNQVPCTFLPFGEGPRTCIGLRFGLMQTKIGLATILKNFRLTLNEKTPVDMKLDPNTFFLSFQDTLYLDAEKIL